MSFIGATEIKNIKCNAGKISKLFMTAQEGGYWVATVLYTKDGVAKSHVERTTEKVDTYLAAQNWFLNEVDQQAAFDPL